MSDICFFFFVFGLALLCFNVLEALEAFSGYGSYIEKDSPSSITLGGTCSKKKKKKKNLLKKWGHPAAASREAAAG